MSDTATPWTLDQFADVRIMRYEIPDWDSLTSQQRVLCYYLSEAALCGRDITYDQNCAENLTIRRILEAIYRNHSETASGEEWEQFVVYLKRVWFSNGIHHHYSGLKFVPECRASYIDSLLKATPFDAFPVNFADTSELIQYAITTIYDPTIAPRRLVKSGVGDLLLSSSMNFYQGVTQKEAHDFYERLHAADGTGRLPFGMNTQLVKRNGKLEERVWRVGGMYTEAIEQVVYWLKKAQEVSETPQQQQAIELLIKYYESGDLATFNDYSIAWVRDTLSRVDFINGFIEDYGDPLAIKCTWESIVNFKDLRASRRMEILSENAQWFEDNSPTDVRFKKKNVQGITAKVVNAVQLGGECYPAPPVGVNLPNANWIRREHGSKSVTIENISYAYDKASEGNGFLEEFAFSPEEIARARECGTLSSSVHTDFHECLGHGSGQILPTTQPGALRNYSATIEETRADLFALYFMLDPKAVELGILPSREYGMAEYDSYMRNGLLTQIVRLRPGEQIEQDHMRNRALISRWALERGEKNGVVALVTKGGEEKKRYVQIKDYDGLRALFGELLAEIQRITSEGDFEAAKSLVENYGIKVDRELHEEVLARYEALNLAPYGGFVNPYIEPVMEGDKVVDAKIRYTTDYVEQMLHYSADYSFLPNRN